MLLVFLLSPLLSNAKKATEEVDIMNGEHSFISRSMAEEEENLFEARIKEEKEESKHEPEEAPNLNETQFSKLDELLTQTQLYTEFLLEKMDDITLVLSLTLVVSTFDALQFSSPC